MQIGNLSRAPVRSRGIFAFQLMRALTVVTLAATGAYAFSMSVENPDPPTSSLASAEVAPEAAGALPATAGAAPSAGESGRPAPVQIATAEAAMPEVALAAADPDTAPQALAAQALAAPENLSTGDLFAPAAAPTGHAAAPAGGATAPGADPATLAASAPTPPTARASAADPAAAPAAPVVAAAPAVAADAEMTGAVTVASAAAEPASDLVDLNTASFKDLNALRNAGSLGRTIIRHRPYASVEDLVTRKIVRRSVYERIKDQVTVR